MGAVALSRGDYSSAVQQCSQIVKASNDSYEGWFNLAVAYQGNSDPPAERLMARIETMNRANRGNNGHARNGRHLSGARARTPKAAALRLRASRGI